MLIVTQITEVIVTYIPGLGFIEITVAYIPDFGFIEVRRTIQVIERK